VLQGQGPSQYQYRFTPWLLSHPMRIQLLILVLALTLESLDPSTPDP